jgi:hypothetical protein
LIHHIGGDLGTAAEASAGEGPERGHQELVETLVEGGQGLECLPALIWLLYYSPLALEGLRLGGFSKLHPRVRYFKEVSHKEDPFH